MPSPRSRIQEQRQDPLIEEALRWLVVLRDKAASDADRAAFAAWLREDPRHEAAWRQAQRVWMRVGKIGPAFAKREAERAAAEASLPPAEAPVPVLRAAGPRPEAPPVTAARPASVIRRRLLYAAAALAAVAVPAGALLSWPGLLADLRTGAGGRHTIALQDG